MRAAHGPNTFRQPRPVRANVVNVANDDSYLRAVTETTWRALPTPGSRSTSSRRRDVAVVADVVRTAVGRADGVLTTVADGGSVVGCETGGDVVVAVDGAIFSAGGALVDVADAQPASATSRDRRANNPRALVTRSTLTGKAGQEVPDAAIGRCGRIGRDRDHRCRLPVGREACRGSRHPDADACRHVGDPDDVANSGRAAASFCQAGGGQHTCRITARLPLPDLGRHRGPAREELALRLSGATQPVD